jgi:hypothetical protein
MTVSYSLKDMGAHSRAGKTNDNELSYYHRRRKTNFKEH